MNVVILTGRLGKDPEMRGESVLVFPLAVSEYYGGETHTMWVDCAAFGKTAETIKKHVKKGDMILINGGLSVRILKNDDGSTRTFYSVRVGRFEFMGQKKSGGEKPSQSSDDGVPF